MIFTHSQSAIKTAKSETVNRGNKRINLTYHFLRSVASCNNVCR